MTKNSLLISEFSLYTIYAILVSNLLIFSKLDECPIKIIIFIVALVRCRLREKFGGHYSFVTNTKFNFIALSLITYILNDEDKRDERISSEFSTSIAKEKTIVFLTRCDLLQYKEIKKDHLKPYIYIYIYKKCFSGNKIRARSCTIKRIYPCLEINLWKLDLNAAHDFHLL